MKQLNAMTKWFLEEESGQGMVEYGLIIVLIALAVIATLQGLAGGLDGVFRRITTALGGTTTP